MPIRSIVRTLRLVSGLIPRAFVVSHLGNLAIGLHSLDAMQRWMPVLASGVQVTRLLPASADATAARQPASWVAGDAAATGHPTNIAKILAPAAGRDA